MLEFRRRDKPRDNLTQSQRSEDRGEESQPKREENLQKKAIVGTD